MRGAGGAWLSNAISRDVASVFFYTLGRPVDITADAIAFHNGCAVHKQCKGVVLVANKGEAIAKVLDNKKAALLLNGGLLTCGGRLRQRRSGSGVNSQERLGILSALPYASLGMASIVGPCRLG